MKYSHFQNEIDTYETKHDAFGIFFAFGISLVLIGIIALVVVNIFHLNSLVNSL